MTNNRSFLISILGKLRWYFRILNNIFKKNDTIQELTYMLQRLVMAASCLLLDTGIVTITFDPCDYFRYVIITLFATNSAYYSLQKSGSSYIVLLETV